MSNFDENGAKQVIANLQAARESRIETLSEEKMRSGLARFASIIPEDLLRRFADVSQVETSEHCDEQPGLSSCGRRNMYRWLESIYKVPVAWNRVIDWLETREPRVAQGFRCYWEHRAKPMEMAFHSARETMAGEFLAGKSSFDGTSDLREFEHWIAEAEEILSVLYEDLLCGESVKGITDFEPLGQFLSSWAVM